MSRDPKYDTEREYPGDELPLFPESERFELIRELGQGGMGAVYLAYDRELDAQVALKTLTRVDPAGLYRFKKEFRALANVSAPNLVVLHELISEGDNWFLTMEYVAGREFFAYLRDEPPEGFRSSAAPTLNDALEAPDHPHRSGVVRRVDSEGLPRLRAAFEQLAQGVIALHAAGKLHKDLKPSNVLVTDEGRVVLLDFGMVDESATPPNQTLDDRVFGTPAYMSPEQAAGQPTDEAADWYSYGAMLYEALTGRLPLDGTALDIILFKQHRDPLPPRSLVEAIPEDLDSLCVALLDRDPARRPGGQEVLEVIRGERTTAPPVAELPASRTGGAFVGRSGELQFLLEAFDDSRKADPVVVLVNGISGIGKSTLLKQLGNRLCDDYGAVVLAGRCYERESVPFKAIDSLVDSLGRYLKHLPDREAAALLPRNVQALARLFPVLRQVQVIEQTPERLQAPDPPELRRRGFSALKELLARVSDRQPLCLVIDDLQWGDGDSAALLSHLLGPPDPARVLVLCAFRPDPGGSNDVVSALEQAEWPLDLRRLELGPLSHVDATELARMQLQDAPQSAQAQAEEIAREADGSPFFVGELCRVLGQPRAKQARTVAPGAVSLEHTLQARIGDLGERARRVLVMVAVAARPVTERLALEAAGLSQKETTVWSALRSRNFVHSIGSAGMVECSHYRVREAVVAQLGPADFRAAHRRLAKSLEDSDSPDPEALAYHYQLGGDHHAAAKYVERAAAEASQGLAFARAARLYRWLLRVGERDSRQRAELERKLADALAAAGQSADAASAYLRARAGAPRTQALDLERLAAEHFLRSGYVEEGLQTLERVLSAVGLRLPRTPMQALTSLLMRRARLKLRGLRFVERSADEVPPDLMLRIDTCWSASSGLGLIDFVRGSDFQTQHLLLALEAGEPARVARALAIEAGYQAADGSASRVRTRQLVERAREVADRIENPHAQGLSRLADGMSRWHLGQWRESLALCDEAEVLFRERCSGVTWEIATTHVFQAAALFWLGRLRVLAHRGPEDLREAKQNGDLFATSDLQTGYHVLPKLMLHEPSQARAMLEEEKERWSGKGFHLQHWNQLLADSYIDLYEGRGGDAHERMEGRWAALRRSLLLQVQAIRVEAYLLRGQCAVAAAAQSRDEGPILRSVLRSVRRIESERLPWANGLAWTLAGAVHELRSDIPRARAALQEAIGALDAAEMAGHAAAARYRLGRLLEGREGAALMDDATHYLSQQGVLQADRLVAVLAPGH